MNSRKFKLILCRVTLVLIICAVAILFASCDKEDNTSPTGSNQTEPAPTEPVPTEPVPTEPAPTEPAPTEVPTENPTDDPTEKPTDEPTDEPIKPECEHEYLNDCDATCEKCGEVRDVTHSEQIVLGEMPTCTEDGHTAYIICSLCQSVLEEPTVIPATGHTAVSIPPVSVTCTEDGSEGGVKCSVCQSVLTEPTVIPATGHNEVVIPAVPATCTKDGKESGVKCSICQTVLREPATVPAKGHTEVDMSTVPATCTEDGSKGGVKCSVCGTVLKEPTVLPATGHRYSEYLYDDNYHWRECTHSGCTYKTIEKRHIFRVGGICETCNYKMSGIYTIDMEEYPGEHPHHFDFIRIDGIGVAGVGLPVSAKDFTQTEIENGQNIALIGWIGFSYRNINKFGYFFDNDKENAIFSDGFKKVPESNVIDAGGEYRFTIDVSIDSIGAGTHTLSYVAETVDGTYVIIKKIEIQIPEAKPIPPDGNIEKAEKEEIGDVDMIMIETSNTNEYTTPAGLKFTASGQGITFSGGRFTIKAGYGVKINFNDYTTRFSENFNKYKIAYYSSAPLKVTVTYSENGSLVTDVVYLEAGDDMLFNCLTLGYLDRIYSKHIMSLDIKILGSASTATFALYDVQTEKVATIKSSGLTYLYNGRYRLGIKLSWGGGISFLKDGEDGNMNIGNLINDADTGRLVQQSYYGTNNPTEYDPGSYGDNTTWNYNPVQGGNLHNQHSRIIDFVIKDYSIYIKAQPRDWAKTEITPSYMENVYTLYPDRVQVDNRFVDFANFKHNPVRDQELPAFYTIGYLNTFKFYNGTRPWQNDTLTVKPNLDFWGGNPNAYFAFKKGNTETWCAWVNNETDFGIGLYTPNIDRIIAGRHAYDQYPDEESSSSTACNYASPLNQIKIVSFEALEYSYLITTGSTAEIRALFREYKDFAGNTDLTSSVFGYKNCRT